MGPPMEKSVGHPPLDEVYYTIDEYKNFVRIW